MWLCAAVGGSFPPDQDVDYNNEPVVVRFVAGSSQSCVTIGIHDDSQPEITEAFEVFIMPSSAAKYTVRMPSRAEVYIADNDREYTFCVLTASDMLFRTLQL